MGLDLTLCPDRWSELGLNRKLGWFLAYDRLSLTRDYWLYSQIADIGRMPEVKPVCLPKKMPKDLKFQWYDDDGLQTRTRDPYGSPLTYVYAYEIARIETDKIGEYNKAVLAFIKTLPPQTAIVLWWH